LTPPLTLSGKLTAQGGQRLLSALKRLGCAGTLYLEGQAGDMVVVLDRQGEVSSFRLSPQASLEQPLTHFLFHASQSDEEVRPRLPSFAATSPVSALRALPALGSETRLEGAFVDFRALLAHLQGRGFSGALMVRASPQEGLVLLYRGALQAAVYSSEGRLVAGTRALRHMYRQCLEGGGGQIALQRLDPKLAAALSGLALGCAVNAAGPELKSFSGVEVSRHGYLVYEAGQVFLVVEAPTLGPPRLYAAAAGLPSLDLPERPTGWEKRDYRLTLRGRDALNPMTDLYLSLPGRVPQGRALLKQLELGVPTAELAGRLRLEEEALKELLETLQADGLIRAV
jgi:hypothetical protein